MSLMAGAAGTPCVAPLRGLALLPNELSRAGHPRQRQRAVQASSSQARGCLASLPDLHAEYAEIAQVGSAPDMEELRRSLERQYYSRPGASEQVRVPILTLVVDLVLVGGLY